MPSQNSRHIYTYISNAITRAAQRGGGGTPDIDLARSPENPPASHVVQFVGHVIHASLELLHGALARAVLLVLPWSPDDEFGVPQRFSFSVSSQGKRRLATRLFR